MGALVGLAVVASPMDSQVYPKIVGTLLAAISHIDPTNLEMAAVISHHYLDALHYLHSLHISPLQLN